MNKSQYFYRAAVFTRKNNQIGLADINQPDSISPLDDWMGTVLSLADGHHTVQQLVDYMAQQYPSPPSNLEETLDSVIERLMEGGLVKLSDEPVALPYYLASPIEELELTVAKRKMQEDGYNVGLLN